MEISFVQTVEENFEGDIAELAEDKVVSIADLIFYKIHNYYDSPGVAKPKN
jgi:hemoglobin